MPAKPIIDIDVVVADPTDEAAYVSALVGEGWERTGTGKGEGEGEHRGGAGLQFMLREPGWHNHRFFVFDESAPPANVHVFGPGCPEVVRHQIFREWLLTVSEKSLLISFELPRQSGVLSTRTGKRWEQFLSSERDKKDKGMTLLDLEITRGCIYAAKGHVVNFPSLGR